MKDIFSCYEVVSYRQAKALSVLMNAYSESSLCPDEPLCFGYNSWSGNFYIAFENVSLQIMLDNRENLLWMTTDIETGNEEFFDTEEEAMEYLDTLE